MRTVISLFVADLRKNRPYYVIAVLGVAAAVAGVVWNYGSFATAKHQNEVYASRLLGVYDLLVGAEDPYRSPFARRPKTDRKNKAKPTGLPRSDRPTDSVFDLGPTVDRLKQSPGVAKVDTAFTSRVVLQHELPWTGPPLSAVMFAVDPGSFTPPTELSPDQWLPHGPKADRAIVIDRQQAQRMAAKLGDTISVTGPGARVKLKVRGIVDATRLFMRSGNVYLTISTAARIMGRPQDPPAPNIAAVQLAAGTDKTALRESLITKDGGLRVIDAEQIAAEFNSPAGRRTMGGGMGLLVIVLSFAVSLLIVFITLNLGLSKRVRQFGLLRMIGASRSQIAAFILLESLFMGILGSAAGIVLGALVLEVTTLGNPTLFPNGMTLGLAALGYGVACGLGGALIAACLPVIKAIRQAPLAVMTNAVPRRHTRAIIAAAIVGGLLLLPALLVSLIPDLPVRPRALLFTATGLGRYSLSVDPISRKWDRQVMPEVVEALRNDPDVSAADSMWAERIIIQSKAVKLKAPPPGSGSEPGEGANECLLLGTDAPAPPFDLLRGRWISGSKDDVLDVAVSDEVAQRYGVDVNGYLTVGRGEASQRLRVVGIVDEPPFSSARHGVYTKAMGACGHFCGT